MLFFTKSNQRYFEQMAGFIIESGNVQEKPETSSHTRL